MMRFARRIHDAIAGPNVPSDFASPNFGGAGEDQVEFPLGGVAMKGKVRRAGRQPNELDFKRRLPWKFRPGFRIFERQRYVATKFAESAFWRFAFNPGNVLNV